MGTAAVTWQVPIVAGSGFLPGCRHGLDRGHDCFAGRRPPLIAMVRQACAPLFGG